MRLISAKTNDAGNIGNYAMQVADELSGMRVTLLDVNHNPIMDIEFHDGFYTPVLTKISPPCITFSYRENPQTIMFYPREFIAGVLVSGGIFLVDK